MSLRLFEGPAGTGKTTRILAAARERLRSQPLSDGQRVLALTKYHGSRRRMDQKLRDRATGVGRDLDCLTIDSFSYNLVIRWRSLLDHLHLEYAEGDFQSITRAAGALLERANVARWVARRYPLVVIDEMQDCKAGEVNLLRGLAPYVHMLCGADTFQDLSGDQQNEAVAWALANGDVVTLDQVFRTDQPALLAAAHALRHGERLVSDPASGFELLDVRAPEQCGAVMSWRIKSWSRSGQIAVISATAQGTSPFIDRAVNWVTTKTSTAKSGATAGPYAVPWEHNDDGAKRKVLRSLGLPERDSSEVCCKELALRADQEGFPELRDWLRKQIFVLGRKSTTVSEVVVTVDRLVRLRRAFGPSRQWRRRAMTIHQAKNQEFDSVIALWPFQIAGDLERQRRLLYNAITRARRRAIVVVQDPKNKRLKEGLFVGSA